MINAENLGFFPWEQLLFDGKYESITEEYFKKNKVIVSDCDGVLTDGNHIYSPHGKAYKSFGSCDKEAMRFMLKCKWKILFVTEDPTGRDITTMRMSDWGIKVSRRDFVIDDLSTYQAGYVMNASAIYRQNIIKRLQDEGSFVAYIGDSLSDTYPGMQADIFCTPGNAIDIARECSDLSCSTSKIGGQGAFADILYKLHYKVGTGDNGLVNL